MPCISLIYNRIKHDNHDITEVKNMCSVGGEIYDFDIKELDADAKYYKCGDCGNEFKGFGTKLKCPACHSAKVSKVSEE